MNIQESVIELGKEGYCCSQIVIQVALDILGQDSPELIKAMKGLCYGMQIQNVCGAVSAGTCFLALFDSKHTKALNTELFAWFRDKYDCLDCAGLIGQGKLNPMKCCQITAEVCNACLEILEKNGLLSD